MFDYSGSLKLVRDKLLDGDVNLSLDELLASVSVDPIDYDMALRTTTKGNKVVLKRDPCECNINNYNPSVMLAWQANMDIQYVMDAYACVMYVASYVMKH